MVLPKLESEFITVGERINHKAQTCCAGEAASYSAYVHNDLLRLE